MAKIEDLNLIVFTDECRLNVFITFRVCNVGFAVKTVARIAGLRERWPVLSTALSPPDC